MSLLPLLSSTTFVLMPAVSNAGNQVPDKFDPLFLGSHYSIAASFVLLHLFKPLFMGFECLLQLSSCEISKKAPDYYEMNIDAASLEWFI